MDVWMDGGWIGRLVAGSMNGWVDNGWIDRWID